MDENELRLAISKFVYAAQREGSLNQKLIGVTDKKAYNALLEQFREALRTRTHLQEALIQSILTKGGPMGEE